MKIHITAIIIAKPECLEEVKRILQNLVQQSRQEKACIHYSLHQSIDNKILFTFYEIWKNREGLNAHNEQPYIKFLGKLIDAKLQEPPSIYQTSLL